MRTRLAILLAMTTAIGQPLRGQVAEPVRDPEPIFELRDAYYLAGVGTATLLVAPFDKAAADYLQGAPQARRFLRRMFFAVEHIAQPGAFIVGGGLYAAGRIADDERMADLGLHGTEAIIVGLAVGNILKVSVGRARPYVNNEDPNNFGLMRGLKQDQYRSFPSGHTVIAFAAAAAVTDETRRWWPRSVYFIGPAMYVGASLVGISRMYNNKHWASDVIMGGAIGAFSGIKVVKYHHSRPGNRLDRWLLGVSVVPNQHAEGYSARLLVLPQRGY